MREFGFKKWPGPASSRRECVLDHLQENVRVGFPPSLLDDFAGLQLPIRVKRLVHVVDCDRPPPADGRPDFCPRGAPRPIFRIGRFRTVNPRRRAAFAVITVSAEGANDNGYWYVTRNVCPCNQITALNGLTCVQGAIMSRITSITRLFAW